MTRDMVRLLQFLLWCLSIQKSRQAAMSRHNVQTFEGFLEDSESGTTRRYGHLHNKASGKYVRIVSRNHIDAKGDRGDPFAMLILSTVGFNTMTIQGNSSKYYLCVTSRGEFVARKKWKLEQEREVTCKFRESFSHTQYNQYHVFQREGWLLGFKGNGEPRKAQRNKSDHKSALFLFYQEEDTNKEEDFFNTAEAIFQEILSAVTQKDRRLRRISAERETSRWTLEYSHR